MKRVFLFTGQGAQYAGMAKDIYDGFTEMRTIFSHASDILHNNLIDICFNGTIEEISRTKNLQPIIFCISAGISDILKNNGITPDGVCGFSLGEMTAIYVSKMLSFEGTLNLIQKRGEIMDEASAVTDGVMYSILGYDDDKLEIICRKQEGYVTPANYNSPGQTVISGERDACEEVVRIVLGDGAKRAVKLNVSGAFHSKLMDYKRGEFTEFLNRLSFSQPSCDFYSNHTGGRLRSFTNDYIITQMTNPVRFRQELTQLYNDGYEDYIEAGVGTVLSGLCRRTLNGVNILNTQNIENLRKCFT